MKNTSLFPLAFLVGSLCAGSAFAHGEEKHDEKPAPEPAQEEAGHSHDRATAHGGGVAMTQEFHFETVFRADGIAVYVYDGTQNPVDLSGTKATGTVTVQFRDRSKKPLEAPLRLAMPPEEHSEHNHADGEQAVAEAEHAAEAEQSHLSALIALADVESDGARARIHITDLPGKKEKEVTFLQKVSIAPAADQHHMPAADTHAGHGAGDHH